MSESQRQALAAIDILLETIGVLIPALARQDDDKAYEAVTILLTQALEIYGPEHPIFQQFFPVMDTIEKRISTQDIVGALRQSELFRSQLHEIKGLITNSI